MCDLIHKWSGGTALDDYESTILVETPWLKTKCQNSYLRTNIQNPRLSQFCTTRQAAVISLKLTFLFLKLSGSCFVIAGSLMHTSEVRRTEGYFSCDGNNLCFGEARIKLYRFKKTRIDDVLLLVTTLWSLRFEPFKGRLRILYP